MQINQLCNCTVSGSIRLLPMCCCLLHITTDFEGQSKKTEHKLRRLASASCVLDISTCHSTIFGDNMRSIIPMPTQDIKKLSRSRAAELTCQGQPSKVEFNTFVSASKQGNKFICARQQGVQLRLRVSLWNALRTLLPKIRKKTDVYRSCLNLRIAVENYWVSVCSEHPHTTASSAARKERRRKKKFLSSRHDDMTTKYKNPTKHHPNTPHPLREEYI